MSHRPTETSRPTNQMCLVTSPEEVTSSFIYFLQWTWNEKMTISFFKITSRITIPVRILMIWSIQHIVQLLWFCWAQPPHTAVIVTSLSLKFIFLLVDLMSYIKAGSGSGLLSGVCFTLWREEVTTAVKEADKQFPLKLLTKFPWRSWAPLWGLYSFSSTRMELKY